jgi:signal transduction histidine kinase
MNHSSLSARTLPDTTLADTATSPVTPPADSAASLHPIAGAHPMASGHATVEIAKCDLDRLQALATLGELTGTATHEFNNLLMTIMNYAKLAMRDRTDAGREKALTKILDASQRAARITGTILAQARNRKDTTTATDLAALINDTLELLSREMRKYRVKIETTIDPNTPMAMLSGNQIQRVLINLLVNARQAMADGGTITVSLAPDASSGEVVLTVRDTGAGIPRDQLPRIFDSFYTTKSGPDESGKGGTGLGLASTKEIIDAHGGRIRVESTVGRGTAFIIRLPVA